VPNSIVSYYETHQAAIALRNAGDIAAGGESAEWPEIAARLAYIMETCLGALPLEKPLRNAKPFAHLPNGDWPNLMVIHERSVPRDIDSVWTEWTHYAHLSLIWGSWPGDAGRMQALGTPYIWPIKAVLDYNKSLDGRVRNVQVGAGGEEWKVLSYGDSAPTTRQWYGLFLPIEGYGYNRRIYQV
jgi:hypothetical protein